MNKPLDRSTIHRSMGEPAQSAKSLHSSGTGKVVQMRLRSVARKQVPGDDQILSIFHETKSVAAVSKRLRVGYTHVCNVLVRYLPEPRAAA